MFKHWLLIVSLLLLLPTEVNGKVLSENRAQQGEHQNVAAILGQFTAEVTDELPDTDGDALIQIVLLQDISSGLAAVTLFYTGQWLSPDYAPLIRAPPQFHV